MNRQELIKLNDEKVLKLSREMDKLLNSPDSTKEEIEIKRAELNKAYEYSEYLKGIGDPRD